MIINLIDRKDLRLPDDQFVVVGIEPAVKH